MAEHWLKADLARWGPGQTSPAPAPAEASDYCRSLARRHYENFSVASWFLPAPLRPHVCHLYSYCRWSDDLADQIEDPEASLQLLDWWEGELRACFEGRCRHPVFVALRETIEQFEIPREPFEQLLVAFRQDQWKTRYATWEELEHYCRHSANPVGHLFLYLGRCATPENRSLSDAICTGLQLANFCQGVAEDWERGRFYFPQQLCVQAEYEESDYGRDTPGWRRILQQHLQQAEQLLQAGGPLIDRVPASLRIDIDLFRRGGLEIVKTIRNQEAKVWSGPPKISRLRKMMIVLAAWRGAATGGPTR